MKISEHRLSRHLTPRRVKLLKAIASFQAKFCYSPTMAELAERMGTSRSTVFEHIAGLRKAGLLAICRRKNRSLKLTDEALKLLEMSSEAPSQGRARQGGIPLAGRVAAGSPVEAVEQHEVLDVGGQFGDAEGLFALEVSGDSMIDEGIRHGDYVVCKPAVTADNGQIVVAIVGDDNATLKRFYRETSHIRLQPANRRYSPICTQDCRVQAIVVGLVRRM